MNNSTIILIAIMIVAGIFGGFVNYLLELRDDKDGASLKRSVVVGIGASFLVPLFLNMISSDLVSKSSEASEKLLIFAGFCLIASISSSAFIRTLSDRVLSETKKATKLAEGAKKEVQEFIDLETETDDNDELQKFEKKIDDLSPESIKILLALFKGKYKWRSVSGISKDTGFVREVVKDELLGLAEKELVIEKESKYGGFRWAISKIGQSYTSE